MKYFKKHLNIFLMFCLGASLYAQSTLDCGTTIAEQFTTPSFVNQQQPVQSEGFVVSQVPVKFHIIGAFNGALAIDSAVVFEELELVNETFAAIDIEFVHCGDINFINDNDYLTFTKGQDEDLCDIHDLPNAINIYFAVDVENAAGESICGYAYNFDIKNRVFMDNNCADNGSTLTHELGHSFSLLHTHTTSNGAELANGSNCDNAGDLLCDTPADPRLNSAIVNDECEYTGSEIDDQGDEYFPNTRNLMSYSRKECRDEFSVEQLNQMEAFFQLEGGFLDCTNSPVSTTSVVVDNLQAYPNPSDGPLFINGLVPSSTIKLIDVNGLVYEQKQELTDHANFPLFEQLPTGLYIIWVQTPEGHVQTRRVIKQ